MSPTMEGRAVAAVLAVAAAWRGAVLAVGLPLFHDQVLYARMAERMAAGDWALASLETPCLYQLPETGGSACYPPLFPALLAIAESVGVDASVGGKAVSFVAGLLALGVFHRLARSFLPARPALVALTVFALHPLSTFVGTTAFTESLYLLLVLGAVLAALVGSGSGAAAAAGGLLGLAYLTRPEAVTLVPLVAVAMGVRQPDRRGALRTLGMLLVGLAVVAGPLLWLREAGAQRSWHAEKAAFGAVIDQRLAQGSLERAYFALDAQGEHYAVSVPAASAGAAGRIASDPLAFVVRRGRNAMAKADQVVPAVGAALAVTLSLLTGGIAVRRGRRDLTISVAISGSLAYALALNIVSQARLLALAVPSCALLVAWSLHLCQPWLAAPAGRRLRLLATTSGAVTGVAALGACGVWTVALVHARAPEVDAAERVAPWLAAVTVPSAVLVTHGPGLPYYAGRRHRALPAEVEPSALCRWLDAVEADCVVASARTAEAHGLALEATPCLTRAPGPVEADLFVVEGGDCLVE